MKLLDIKDIVNSSSHEFDINGSFILLNKYKEQEDNLYEGLIKSYPIETIIRAVYSSTFPNSRIAANYINDKLFNSFTLIIEKDFTLLDLKGLLQTAKVYGWIIPLIVFFDKNNQKITELSRNNINKNIFEETLNEYDTITSIRFKFEAKFDVELEKKNWPKYLFCLAPKNVKLKIEKNGLVPKAGKNLDHNQSRIYLAFNKKELIDEMLPQLKRNNSSYEDGVILIILDTNKFPLNVRLFQDINWPTKAVYSIVNIPQKAFMEIKTI